MNTIVQNQLILMSEAGAVSADGIGDFIPNAINLEQWGVLAPIISGFLGLVFGAIVILSLIGGTMSAVKWVAALQSNEPVKANSARKNTVTLYIIAAGTMFLAVPLIVATFNMASTLIGQAGT